MTRADNDNRHSGGRQAPAASPRLMRMVELYNPAPSIWHPEFRSAVRTGIVAPRQDRALPPLTQAQIETLARALETRELYHSPHIVTLAADIPSPLFVLLAARLTAAAFRLVARTRQTLHYLDAMHLLAGDVSPTTRLLLAAGADLAYPRLHAELCRSIRFTAWWWTASLFANQLTHARDDAAEPAPEDAPQEPP